MKLGNQIFRNFDTLRIIQFSLKSLIPLFSRRKSSTLMPMSTMGYLYACNQDFIPLALVLGQLVTSIEWVPIWCSTHKAFHMLNRKILNFSLYSLAFRSSRGYKTFASKISYFRTGQNTASLTHTLKLEMLDMVNVKKEYAAFPGPNPNQRQQYFEGHMIPWSFISFLINMTCCIT